MVAAWSTIASLAFSRIIYGAGHPYGSDPSGTEASVKGMTRQDLVTFYTTYYRPNNATLIVVGDATLSGLPPFLVRDGGVNSGFMIAHVTAAALASENKLLAHPASVDSLPTSANQEDHVSMSTFAARKLGDLADNTAGILAIELLAAAQGVDLRERPTSPALREVMALVRAHVPHYDIDRHFAPDIAAVKALIQQGALAAHAPLAFASEAHAPLPGART